MVLSSAAVALSWIGVLLLMTAHICVASNISKKNASRLSAIGAALSMIAAAGMGIWSVFALNLVWMCISAWGSLIPERKTPLPYGEQTVIVLGLAAAAAWIGGAQMVAWTASAVYVAGWLAFSSGLATRRAYLIACLIAGIAVVPALITLGAHAFAVNETFGAVVSAGSLLAAWRRERTKSVA